MDRKHAKFRSLTQICYLQGIGWSPPNHRIAQRKDGLPVIYQNLAVPMLNEDAL